MNFTFEIKKEIVSKVMNDREIKAFISGVLFSNFVNEKIIKIKLINEELFHSVIELINKAKYSYNIDKNIIQIDSVNLLPIKPNYANAYFAGIFLSSGSISNLNSSSYHLEISFKNELNCDQIMDFAKKHIHFHKIKNKNNYVLYLKKNEYISDFLQIIGAHQSYFSFIDSIIERDFKNQITRIFNLDVHNQNRLVDSNIIFKENYQYILDNNLTTRFKPIELEFYEFKKKNEFLSLSQLSEKLWTQKGIKKTKSGLNHWLIKLRNICEEHENCKQKNN
ncbi:MAG: DNA-binding protein WhiA [Mycoplasma sp.]|nr:DNA-binding protein WhiA [Mycoplasma sp.]